MKFYPFGPNGVAIESESEKRSESSNLNDRTGGPLSHMEFAFVLAPLSVFSDAAPLLAGHAVRLQRRIRALCVQPCHFRYVRRQRQIVVQLKLS